VTVGRGVRVGSREGNPFEGVAVGAHRFGANKQIVGDNPVGVGPDNDGDAVSPTAVGSRDGDKVVLLVGSDVLITLDEGASVWAEVTVG
jgi:hypothetical protein